MVGRSNTILLLIALSTALHSCKPTRHVQEGKMLVTKSTIHLNKGENPHETNVSADDLASVVKQKPNRRILGLIPFHLGVWNYANSRNGERKFIKFLKEDVGEAPVIYEPVLLEKSKEQIERYLRNHGHFDATVVAQEWTDSLETELHFYVNTGPEYRLRKLGFSFEDDFIKAEFENSDNKELKKLKLNRGSVYNTDLLGQERARYSKALKDLGYFTFDKIHIMYDIDTNLQGEWFDLMIRFRNLRRVESINGKDSLVVKPHKKHTIRRVIVNEDFDVQRSKVKLDTAFYRSYIYLFIDKPYVRPARVSRNIFLNKGEYYSLSKTQYTYERINALGTFRFIDIRFNPVPETDSLPELDMVINLNKSPQQAMTFETVGTNRSGNLGISSSVNYRNKNLFRGAEQFDWKVYGGVEWQNTNSTIEGDEESVINKTPINTYEFGTQVTLTIPDFLFRIPNKDLPRIKEPKTSISLALDRQGRPQYDRDLINTTFQWTMRFRSQDQLIVAPVDISVIKLDKKKDFAEQLERTKNALLINSYSDHIIPAGRVSYSNTTQDLSNSLKNYYYYRVNFEAAGNLLRLASAPLGLQKDQGSYLIDTIAFAQYVKADVDFKKNFVLSRNSKYVLRFFAGAGLPLANRSALPFERSFFAGGSNGMRAWRARALGPGNVSDTATYGLDQVGEIQLEFNVEYRFKLIKQLEGAIFADFGNIWFWNHELYSEANFRLNSFYKAIAVAPGAGVRYNLNFFIIRLDAGLQLKDPNLPEGERWAFIQPKTLTNQYRQEWRINNGNPNNGDWKRPEITFNLAINYPF